MAWTQRGYVFMEESGWIVAFWNAREGEVRYLHGYATVQTAIKVLEGNWENPPTHQNGFPTGVRLHD